jgi:hypothetical protein
MRLTIEIIGAQKVGHLDDSAGVDQQTAKHARLGFDILGQQLLDGHRRTSRDKRFARTGAEKHDDF